VMVDRCPHGPSAACELACDGHVCGGTPAWSFQPFGPGPRDQRAVSGALRADEQPFEDRVVDVASKAARRGERPLHAQVAEMNL